MAFPALEPQGCTIAISVFDGSRGPVPAGTEVLFTVRDGNQQQVFRDFRQASTLVLNQLKFFNNFGDQYTVLAFADGYEQAGFTPVHVAPNAPQQVDLMLLGKNADFNFARAAWATLQQQRPAVARLLAAGAASPDEAGNRYSDLMEQHPNVLACLLNLTTAMSQILLPSGTPLDYFKQAIWNDSMKQDRFFGWADARLLEQVRLAALHGQFAPEPASFVFHSGATSSYKQIQFGEANLQLTFHENDRLQIDGVDCVKVEPDIDYFKDLGAHFILEVVPNGVTGGLTDPRQVYVLRWMAGRRAGVPEFDPLYTIV